ncbi:MULTISPECIES: MT-A70 family methyltransferase [unclassified Xanthobacter]|uniref:MT-A70 family methyltransferase n=1 Tax=unclassified Xanthobacter TaxID=2623496 RepID=UPI001F1CB280|nr:MULTISPECIES: MT-A70 family methyltransferase [unclassified Xanthobacter]
MTQLALALPGGSGTAPPLPSPPNWPLAPLRPRAYGRILADPAWKFSTWSPEGLSKSPEQHYPTMQLKDIKALPVADIAAPDCLLILWSTWPHLKQAMEVLASWGFDYKTGGSWIKRTKYGKLAFGGGYIVRSSCEPYLIGTRGNPKVHVKDQRNVLETEERIETDDLSLIPDHMEALRREHSRKPPDMIEMLTRMRPDVPGAELFARETVPGYDVWGNEVTKFNSLPISS